MIQLINNIYRPHNVNEVLKLGGKKLKPSPNSYNRFALNDKLKDSGASFTRIYEEDNKISKGDLFSIPIFTRTSLIKKGITEKGQRFIRKIKLDTSLNGNGLQGLKDGEERLQDTIRYYDKEGNLDKVVTTTTKGFAKRGFDLYLDHSPVVLNHKMMKDTPIKSNYNNSPIPDIESSLNAIM